MGVTTTVRLATAASHQKPKRPSSLLVGNGSNSLSSLNIPIETPTNVMNQLVILQVLDSFISVHHNVGLKVLFLFVCAEIVYMYKRLYSPCFLSQCYCAFNSLVHISSYFYKK